MLELAPILKNSEHQTYLPQIEVYVQTYYKPIFEAEHVLKLIDFTTNIDDLSKKRALALLVATPKVAWIKHKNGKFPL